MATTQVDSPARLRHTHNIAYRSARVDDCRLTLMRDIPTVAEVPLNALMDGVLPAVSHSQLNSVCDLLLSNNQIQDPDEDPRWLCLPVDPNSAKKYETQNFSFLEKIADTIDELQSAEFQSKQKLKVTGATVPLSKRRNKSRPDGYFRLQPGSSVEDCWADTVMPMEFKNVDNKENRIDDFAKVIWSMHHIMRSDARRRFVHGLTCENTKARLWYNDRSDVVASKAFDVNKDWRILVHIILSIQQATAAELGYDPNMVSLPSFDPTSEPQYDITIHNSGENTVNVYRTLGIISDVGADSMVGRGTRVWKVKKVENGQPGGPTYALKMVWVHKDRVQEHVFVKRIKEHHTDYAQYFLTAVDYGFAPLDPANPSTLFDTHNPLGRTRILKPTGNYLATHYRASGHNTSSKMSSASRDSIGHPSDTLNSSEEGYRDFHHLSGHPRQNYVIVFEEIGEPVHDLHQFPRVFTAIQGAWEGLHAIHLDECVHRDVSSGNVLLVPASELKGWNERGVIMDLEYGKEINDTKAPHDVRTGTAAFMATEVAFIEHHRLAELRAAVSGVSSVEALQLEANQEMEQTVNNPFDVPSLITSLPPFRHNPLHDMESIWWLCIWMMFYLAPSDLNGREQLFSYREAFGNRQAKRSFLCTPGVFEKHTSQLQKLKELQPLVAQIRSWAKALNRLYNLSYEKQNELGASLTMIQIDPKTIDISYTLGKRFLQCLLDASKKLTTQFVPLALVPKDKLLTQTTSRSNAENSRESNKQKQGSSSVMPPPPPSRRSKKRRISSDGGGPNNDDKPS